MADRVRLLAGLLLVALATRLIFMGLLPLMDTSEPRYAEIARFMAATGDWITPWFDKGVPFWGKPPLSFWCQALAFRLFGVNEFAVRLPSMLATLAILALIYIGTSRLRNRGTAWLAVVIYATSALGFVAAGAVLTDPFLVIGTTWILISLLLVTKEPTSLWWRYGPFVGLAIGLLSKGPLTLVLCGVPIVACCTMNSDGRARLALFPWLRGSILTALLTLPWYIAAELKTPGFLDYFILGEHVWRFIDPGWVGDLYGSSHEQPRGTIWWFALQAAFPWGFVAIALLVAQVWMRRAGSSWWIVSIDDRLIWAWLLWPLIFFTVAGNILWTYALPSLPSLAMLLACTLNTQPLSVWTRKAVIGLSLSVPIGTAAYGARFVIQPDNAKTEKQLLEAVQHQPDAATAQIVYVGEAPFSARYYSDGLVGSVEAAQLDALLATSHRPPLYVAVRKTQKAQIKRALAIELHPIYENKRYQLWHFAAPPDFHPSAPAVMLPVERPPHG